jgi:ppGpp synthetase/RelA/SpoT-type nucleotidyltranferase
VTLPISRSQLDRLGDRLASEEPSEADYALLGTVLAAYDVALAEVQAALEQLGLVVTGRLKTTGTLIEKLRREQSMKLKGVQDVAGCRIIQEGTRLDQDEAVAVVVSSFAHADKPPRVRDRRSEPSSGYRAVHVVVYVGTIPVEVQIRTVFQDLWAQAFERLADSWGRGIRYGQEPDDPDRVILQDPLMTRRSVVNLLQELSDLIDDVETAELQLLDVEQELELAQGQDTEEDSEHQALLADRRESKETLAQHAKRLRDSLNILVEFARRQGGAG